MVAEISNIHKNDPYQLIAPIAPMQVSQGPRPRREFHELYMPISQTMVKVIRSHRHLLLGDMKGMGSVPPPLNEALCQGSTRSLFRKKNDDKLKAHLIDITPGFVDK